MNRFLLLCCPIFFAGCLSTSSFEPSKATEFRYKNSYTQTLYLPKNALVCIQNKQNNLPKISLALQEFIHSQWQEKALFQTTCDNSHFGLYLFTTQDFYGVFFRSLKLNIIDLSNHKVVANYTLYSTHYEKEVLDNENTLKAFAALFLNQERIFSNTPIPSPNSLSTSLPPL